MTREPLHLEALRRREVQMMGAAISTRSWHDMENAYNQLRDKIDAELTRLHLATKDAADPQSRGQAFDGEGEARELLAQAYEEQIGEGPYPSYARLAREGSGDFTLCSIRAIQRALSSAKCGEEG